MVTISVIKADVGGFVGHATVHEEVVNQAKSKLEEAKDNLILDFRVMHCGDDLELIMTHEKGEDNSDIHKLAWDTFVSGTEVAKQLKLYGAGQDLLSDSFAGNVKGLGPGLAEMSFEERKSDPVIVFMADKTEPGAWNWNLYKIFADPLSTPGLLLDSKMTKGFRFEVHDLKGHKKAFFDCPEKLYYLLSFIGSPGNFCVKRVIRRVDNEIAAVSSVERLNLIAGKYVGKDDPVMIVRAQSGFPAVGEVLDPFAFPHLVAGWMRGSHTGPLMPVGFKDAIMTRFDGPPRVIAAGFQISHGKLIGPKDLFQEKHWDHARNKASEIADYMRHHGLFEPHRLSSEEMEYTNISERKKEIAHMWEPL